MSAASARVRARARQNLDKHATEARDATFRYACVETAEQALGTLAPDRRVCLMTKGQFSMLDLLRAILGQIGPADVVVSTWTAGIRDVENAKWLLETAAMRSFRMLVDKQFPAMQPAYARRITELFGVDALRVTQNHAKFAILRNEQWAVTVRTSMNLNRNPRWEWAEIETTAAMADFLDRMVAELYELGTPGIEEIPENVADTFSGTLHDATCGDVQKAEMTPRERWARLGYTMSEIEARERRAGTPYERGLDALEDQAREATIAEANGGDTKALHQVRIWIEACRREMKRRA